MENEIKLGEGLTLDVRKELPLWVFGKQGSGKTYLLDKVEEGIKGINKKSDIERFSVLGEDSPSDILYRIIEIDRGMDRRLQLIEMGGYEDIEEYNEKNKGDEIGHKYVLLDDYGLFAKGLRKDTADKLGYVEQVIKNVTKLGDKLGIHLVVTVQDMGNLSKPEKEFRKAKTVITFKLRGGDSYKDVLGEDVNEKDELNLGDCYASKGVTVIKSKIE